MRYLKPYESFKIVESSSSEEDLLGTINDILLPISDVGIDYKVSDFVKVGLIYVVIHRITDEVNISVEHLTNYLKDLGYEYYINSSYHIIHISIVKKFNEDIENDFFEIIKDIREIKDWKDEKKWINKKGQTLFNEFKEDGYLYYDYNTLYTFFVNKYNLSHSEMDEVIRYLINKYLKLKVVNLSVS